MKFKYKARTKEGELQAGFVEAASKEGALNVLSGHELYILSLDEVTDHHWYDFFVNFFERVKSKDLMIFTRQFSALLGAKIPLADSLRTLHNQTKSALLRETITEVANDVDAGLSLSQALERHENIFSLFYVNMIRSAEITGRMEETVGFLADYLEKQTLIISKVRNALIYPAFIIFLFVVVAGIMVTLVLPQIEPIFEESNVELPFLTQLLFSTGNFLATWWWAVLLFVLLIVFVFIDYLKTPEGKAVWGEVILKTPIVGKLFGKLYLTRFAESTSVLIRSGIPVAQAIEIAGHTIGSVIYREALHRAAEGVRKGALLSQSLEVEQELFPPMIVQMVAIGESTGRLEELLGRVSTFFSREVDETVGNLVELIQPILMVVIGLLVGVLFASILMPIYDLARAF